MVVDRIWCKGKSAVNEPKSKINNSRPSQEHRWGNYLDAIIVTALWIVCSRILDLYFAVCMAWPYEIEPASVRGGLIIYGDGGDGAPMLSTDANSIQWMSIYSMFKLTCFLRSLFVTGVCVCCSWLAHARGCLKSQYYYLYKAKAEGFFVLMGAVYNDDDDDDDDDSDGVTFCHCGAIISTGIFSLSHNDDLCERRG